ncbi:hypothetical protein EP7_001227 [Isosphaeraceae bacterium EP7]
MERPQCLDGIRKILEDDSLTEDLAISPKTWDSIEIMSILALIDRAGKEASVADIHKCKSIKQLIDLACGL